MTQFVQLTKRDGYKAFIRLSAVCAIIDYGDGVRIVLDGGESVDVEGSANEYLFFIDAERENEWENFISRKNKTHENQDRQRNG